MRRRTLIVLGSSLTGLAVVRTAARAGMRCLMLDDVPGPGSRTRMAEFHRLAAHDLEPVARFAPAAGAAAAVIADSDRWLRFVRTHRAELSGLGWQVLHPDPEALAACLDKSAFLRWCARHDLPAPAWHDASEPESIPPSAYPLMLRPEWTQHSSGTGLPKALEIRAPDELHRWLERFAAADVTPSLCQSLLRPGLRQLSIGAARNAEGRTLTFVAEKIRPDAGQCAGGTFVVPSRHDEAEALAVEALHRLGHFGVAEVEVLHDPVEKASYLIEINARPWLQFGLPHASGCDLLGHVLGTPEHRRGRQAGAGAWLYFSSDIYACFARGTGLVRSGRLGLGDYLMTLAKANVYALWDWRDPRPAIVSAAQTARAVVRRALRSR